MIYINRRPLVAVLLSNKACLQDLNVLLFFLFKFRWRPKKAGWLVFEMFTYQTAEILEPPPSSLANLSNPRSKLLSFYWYSNVLWVQIKNFNATIFCATFNAISVFYYLEAAMPHLSILLLLDDAKQHCPPNHRLLPPDLRSKPTNALNCLLAFFIKNFSVFNQIATLLAGIFRR